MVKIRYVLMVSGLGLILAGTGVAIAQSQSPSPSPPSSTGSTKEASRSAFLDDVAKRLGIQRSTLDDSLQAMALDQVSWAETNGFITKDEADELRQRIRSGGSDEVDHHGFPGFGIGLGPPLGHGSPERGEHRDGGSSELTAAASYLGLSTGELADRLESKPLADVAKDQGKSVDGLKQALRTARKTDLDEAVTDGEITPAQENALLSRFDANADDLVNGIPPGLTDLAKRLGVDRARLIAAVKGAATDQVDAALARGLITKAQADAIKQRIQSGAGFPLGGFGPGPCGGFGHFGIGLDRTVIGA